MASFSFFVLNEGDAASNVQFFLTDSSQHFLRGALYFFNPPNPDSIAPVLQFVRGDIDHIAQTLVWRWLACYPAHDEHNEANQKHEYGNLVDAVHEAQVQIHFLTLEKIPRVEVV